MAGLPLGELLVRKKVVIQVDVGASILVSGHPDLLGGSAVEPDKLIEVVSSLSQGCL